jgi:amino acid permease
MIRESMIIKRLTELMNVKTLVTFAVTFVFVFLSVKGRIASDTAMSVVVMVLGFYFGTQLEKSK